MVYAEQVLVIVSLSFLLIWIELKLRVLARHLAQSTMQSVGVWLILLGGVLLVLSSMGVVNQKYALYLTAIGFLVYIIGWVRRILAKKEGLEIEGEKREYLKRVRKGLTIDDAEKKARNYLKSKVHKKLKRLGSSREFKTWKVFFEDSDKKKYQVVIDMDGDIVNWENISDVPSWLRGPY